MGYSSTEWTALTWVPYGLQLLSESLLQHGLSKGCSFIQVSFTCSSIGSSMGCRWISVPPWSSMGCRGTTCFTMVFSMGCRRISTVAPGAPPPPSSLSFAQIFLFLKQWCSIFYPFLNITEMPPVLLTD